MSVLAEDIKQPERYGVVVAVVSPMFRFVQGTGRIRGESPVFLYGKERVLEAEVERQTSPNGKTYVESGREVVLQERHVAGVGDEAVGSIIHYSVRLLYKTAVNKAEAKGDASVRVGEMNGERDVYIVHCEFNQTVGFVGFVLSTTLREVGLN